MTRTFSAITKEQDTVGAFLHHEPLLIQPSKAGPLSGLSCGVKDLFDIAGCRTGFGNPTWRDTHEAAAKHAPTVQRLLDEGAHIVGKTISDELAFSLTGDNFHYGAPLNTEAPNRITGGSSSGSAAAVSAGLCDFALGTDTGGSVRAPASFCGLYGFRPTHDVISRDGVCCLAGSFDTVGWFARQASVFKLVGDVLLPEDSANFCDGPIGWLHDVWHMVEARDASQSRQKARSIVQTLGNVQSVHLSEATLENWFDVFRTLQFAEVAQELGPWVDRYNPLLGPGVSERLKSARTLSDSQIEGAKKGRKSIIEFMHRLLDSHALLVLPTTPGAAPLRGLPIEMMERYRRTAMRLLCIAGLAGYPQVTLPLLQADGLPLGLSLISRPGTDRQLLQFAADLG